MFIPKSLLIERWNPDHEDSEGALWKDSIGNIHRDGDQPAFISKDGVLAWVTKGKVQRGRDKPAIVDYSRQKLEWLKDGERHRDKGKPSTINLETGHKEWCENGTITAYTKEDQNGNIVIVLA